MILYHYGQALRTVTQSPTHLCYLEAAMLADTAGIGISLYSLAQENPPFAQSLNDALRQSIAIHEIYPRNVEQGIELYLEDPSWDANAFLRGKMEYAPYKYEPVVYFVKRPIECIPNRQPTIVIAQDVNDCDDVAGWRGANEVIVSENEAKTSSEPIIFVGPGLGVFQSTSFTGGVNEVILTEPVAINTNTPPAEKQGVGERTSMDIDVDIHQIDAGFRYEKGNRSEVVGFILIYDPGVWEYIYPWFDFSPRRIHKDDINVSRTFTNDLRAFSVPIPDGLPGGWSIFYGTWEEDWWASSKRLDNPCSTRNPVFVKMKYSHEWYFFACGYSGRIFPTSGSTWEVINEKCRFILIRKN